MPGRAYSYKNIRLSNRGFILLLLLVFNPLAHAQILINEFSASNSNTIADPEYDDYSDWIELYNNDTDSWNLKNFYLTDNFGTPDKWQIPIDTILEPGGFIIIWADGKNSGLHTGYKISASGEELALYSPAFILMDSLSFKTQQADISHGRILDGGPEWGYFTLPTPGSSNNTEAFSEINHSIPAFSQRGGFYTSPLSVTLSTNFGGEIRFTKDGSEPQLDSPIYSEAIVINSTTILRARIFKPDMVPGPIITQSYFINENSTGEKLPLVSIATNRENFWDPVSGIYTQDFKPDWEIPVNIELFENNGSDRAAFNQMAGVKINGLYSWQLPQKMLGVYFKKAYGDGNLDYQITPQRNRTSYKSFALRASGSDWSYSLFRDMLGQHATMLNMDLEIMGFKPAILYVNGEYMGIHNIREKVDADYIEKSYSMEPQTFDLIENQKYPEAGDMDAYDHLLTLLDKDLSIDANYDAIGNLVDIENFTDLAITEMAVRNTSINHNVMCWKPKEGGKWRWVVMDLDRGFFKASSSLIDFYLSQDQLLLDELFQNQEYKEYFAKRLSAQLYTSFNAKRMCELIDYHAGLIKAEIPHHIERWAGTTSSYGNAMPSEVYWQEQLANMKTFVEERPAALLNDLQNYGFSGTGNLSLSTFPAEAGLIKIDGLKVPGPFCAGPYLMDVDMQLEATEKPGFDFSAWYILQPSWIVPTGSNWKYLDTGVDPGPGWTQDGFNDSNWNSGPAQLGYGDGDENTVLAYGGNSSDKYITSYFRKQFIVPESGLEGEFFLDLLKDDGAIVYINGEEILRSNIQSGDIDYRTYAQTAIGGETENLFITYHIQNKNVFQSGTNILAVEVHQSAANSSDISFDLGIALYDQNNETLYSTDKITSLTLTKDQFLSARYKRNNYCTIPPVIDSEITLSSDCSPYVVNENVTITQGGTLKVDPGVEIWMPGEGNIFVNGVLEINGTDAYPVKIKINPDYPVDNWGGMVFKNTPGNSILNNLILEDASEGPDPVLENAAISSFNADLNMDRLIIEKVKSNPIVSRYSEILLTNSSLHSEVSGDLINVKYGHAIIENCKFKGNDQPDADAIDYDDVENGIIRSCIFTDFYGFNSDAIDIGENASNIIIDTVFAYNVSDKGVSLGQHSSARISNSAFYNCNMGVAVKDSSTVHVQECIFYSNTYPVACYEKNIGLAGGNAFVKNSILSNSSGASYLADASSKIQLQSSLSDNLPLPDTDTNLYGNPLFKAPSIFNFELAAESPWLASGNIVSQIEYLGNSFKNESFNPPIMISEFFVNGSNLDLPEFITLYNPSTISVDLSGYSITKGITVEIPQGVIIGPSGKVYLTDNGNHSLWTGINDPVVQWIDGKLSDNGESVQLEEAHGIVVDYFVYDIDKSWPFNGFSGDYVFILNDFGTDNHFPENWSANSVSNAIKTTVHPKTEPQFRVYPNPSKGLLYLDYSDTSEKYASLFNVSGHIIETIQLNGSGSMSFDLSTSGPGIYFLKIGQHFEKIIVF